MTGIKKLEESNKNIFAKIGHDSEHPLKKVGIILI
jgi:hypothetical protein